MVKTRSARRGMVTCGLGQKPEKNYTTDADVKKKKLNSLPSVLRHRICDNPEGNYFNAVVRRASIRGGFDGRQTPAFRFLTRSAIDHTLVSQTGFLHFFSTFSNQNVSDHTTVTQTGGFS